MFVITTEQIIIGIIIANVIFVICFSLYFLLRRDNRHEPPFGSHEFNMYIKDIVNDEIAKHLHSLSHEPIVPHASPPDSAFAPPEAFNLFDDYEEG